MPRGDESQAQSRVKYVPDYSSRLKLGNRATIYPDLLRPNSSHGTAYAVQFMSTGWDVRETFQEALKFAFWQVDEYQPAQKAIRDGAKIVSVVVDAYGPVVEVFGPIVKV